MDPDSERRLRQGLAALSEHQPLSYQELALLGEIRALRGALAVLAGLVAAGDGRRAAVDRLRSAMESLPADAQAERETFRVLLAAIETSRT